MCVSHCPVKSLMFLFQDTSFLFKYKCIKISLKHITLHFADVWTCTAGIEVMIAGIIYIYTLLARCKFSGKSVLSFLFILWLWLYYLNIKKPFNTSIFCVGMPDTVPDIFSIIVLGSQVIEETVINLRCGEENASLCTSLWFFNTVMAHGVLEHALFMSQLFIIFPLLHSRRITRNQCDSEMWSQTAVCSRVYEHITEIRAKNFKCSSGGELNVVPEELTAYLSMLSRTAYFLFLFSKNWDFL